MKVIKLLSNENNMLIRILERYEEYIKKDDKLTDKYKELESKDIHIIKERINGVIPPKIYPEIKPIKYNLNLKGISK